MSGMKRFVAYIYSYENGEKNENIGFAKMELRAKEGRMEIHIRGAAPMQKGVKVNLFIREQEEIVAIPLGEMPMQGGRGNFLTAFELENVMGTELNFWVLEGILLLSEDGSIFMSRWKEGEPFRVMPEQIRLWEKKQVPEESDTEQEPTPTVEPPQPQPVQPPQPQPVQPPQPPQPTAQPPESTQPPHPAHPQETVSATELPVRNIYPQCDWETCWEFLLANHEHFAFYKEGEITCVKIELKHIRELPRRYWYLGNNSFLLHGFFNYRYLVVGKMEERTWFIGVPGIYQAQERVMATIFGFPEFMPEPVENQFGYWYRIVEE